MSKPPILTDIILLDVIAFSLLSDTQQASLIEQFSVTMRKTLAKMVSRSDMELCDVALGYIPTGDGFYLLLKPRLKGLGVLMAVVLKNISDQLAKRLSYFNGVRIAVHTGSITPIHDILGSVNYVGSGMNTCARMFYAPVQKEDPFYDDGYIVISHMAGEAYNAFLIGDSAFSSEIGGLEFGEFREISFRDKHGIGYDAFLVKNTQKDLFFYFPDKAALDNPY